MSDPLERELARNPKIATKTPREYSEADRNGLAHTPTGRNTLRHLEPGPTSGAVEVAAASVAKPATAGTPRQRFDSSLWLL